MVCPQKNISTKQIFSGSESTLLQTRMHLFDDIGLSHIWNVSFSSLLIEPLLHFHNSNQDCSNLSLILMIFYFNLFWSEIKQCMSIRNAVTFDKFEHTFEHTKRRRRIIFFELKVLQTSFDGHQPIKLKRETYFHHWITSFQIGANFVISKMI